MKLRFHKPMLPLLLLAASYMIEKTEAVEISGLVRLYKLDGDLTDSAGSGEDLVTIPRDDLPIDLGGPEPAPPEEIVTYETRTLLNGASRLVARTHCKGFLMAGATGLPGGNSPRTIMGWFRRESYADDSFYYLLGGGIFGYGDYANTTHYEHNYASVMNVVLSGPGIYTNHNLLSFGSCCNDDQGNGWSPYYYVMGQNDKFVPTPWVHFAFTHDGTTTKGYINGNLHKSAVPIYTYDTAVDSTGSLWLGGEPTTLPDGSYYGGKWWGQLSEYAIFDRALTSSEIASIYNDPNGIDKPVLTEAPTTSPTDSPTWTPTLTPSAKPSISPSMTSADKFEWYITPLTNGTMNGETALVMEYNISNHKFDFDVFQEDCSTKVEGALDETEIVTSLGDGFVNVTASIAINQTEIESYGNDIWTSSINGGEIKFCVVLSLLLEDENEDITVNFFETNYKIDVDKTTNFSVVDVATERTGPLDGGTTAIDYEQNITTFQCNDDYSPIDPVPALSQGDILQACVQVEDNESIFEVDYVQDMNITQAGNDNSPVVVVSNRTEFTYDELTFTECNGGTNQICRIKFQLLGMFFENSDPADLDVNGILFLKLKDSRLRRSLSSSAAFGFNNNGGNVANRNVVENESENSFELHVSLEKEDKSTSHMNRAREVAAALLAIVGLYGGW